MIRLDPAHPPVWRSATCLQFGVDAVVRIDDPASWQERLVKELERGIPDPGYRGLAVALGATAAQADAFLETLAPALGRSARPVVRATVRMPEAFPIATAAQVIDALAHAGLDVVAEDPLARIAGEAAHAGGSAPDVVVLLAQHVVEPRRVLALMAADTPHLPVVFTAGRVEVGPLVHPGASACLSCVQADRRATDQAWPWILAQLVDRVPVEVTPALALEAGLLAARLLSAAPAPTDRSVEVHDGRLRRRWRVHRRREDCGCRSPGGIATASALDDRSSAPTRRSRIAQPA
jgi:hypothetical protein